MISSSTTSSAPPPSRELTESSIHPTVRKLLLASGVVSSAWYVATDFLATSHYAGYSITDQVFSELFATGAPTRPLMVALNGVPYAVLVTTFSAGIWATFGRTRSARIIAAMLVGYAVTGIVGGVIFPMASRGTDATLRNVLHIPATIVMSLFILVAIGVGATLLGRRFRYYSFATIAVLLMFGFLTSLQAPQIAANETTPWVGALERVNIYATMIWIAVLASALLRSTAKQPQAGVSQ